MHKLHFVQNKFLQITVFVEITILAIKISNLVQENKKWQKT